MDYEQLMALVIKNQEMLGQLISQQTQAKQHGGIAYKHDIGATYTGPFADMSYIHEQAFFQQCELEDSILNFTIQPRESMINYIPTRPSIFNEIAYGALTAFEQTVTGDRPTDVCMPGQVVGGSFEFCKLKYPWSRVALNSGTFELDTLIRKACAGERDSFYFVGDLRGIQSPPNRRLDPLADRGLITQSAVMRIFAIMARVFQETLCRMFWVGNPTNNTTPVGGLGPGYAEFIGMTYLIDDDIPGSAVLAPYLESSTGDTADCSAMNSDVKVFDACIGEFNADGYNIFMLLQELEDTLYRRASAMSLLPVDWRFVMNSLTWTELTKVLPCERSTDGCVNLGAPLVNGDKVVNLDMQGLMRERERLETSRTLTLNGRTYPVLFDDCMPCSRGVDPNQNQLNCDIFFIPWSAAGEELLFFEFVPYNLVERYLSPIPSSQDTLRGWVDGGRYHSVVSQILRCFNVDTKTENRLIFRGQPLAGRITGIKACTIQEKPAHIIAEKTQWGVLT